MKQRSYLDLLKEQSKIPQTLELFNNSQKKFKRLLPYIREHRLAINWVSSLTFKFNGISCPVVRDKNQKFWKDPVLLKCEGVYSVGEKNDLNDFVKEAASFNIKVDIIAELPDLKTFSETEYKKARASIRKNGCVPN